MVYMTRFENFPHLYQYLNEMKLLDIPNPKQIRNIKLVMEIYKVPYVEDVNSSIRYCPKPVTAKMWREYCIHKKQKMPKPPKCGWKPDYPVVNISWYKAMSYTQWASQVSGLNIRLPSLQEFLIASFANEVEISEDEEIAMFKNPVPTAENINNWTFERISNRNLEALGSHREQCRQIFETRDMRLCPNFLNPGSIGIVNAKEGIRTGFMFVSE